MLRYLIVTVFILLFQVLIKPQNEISNFNQITLEDGLSQNTVYCILQDAEGFLWFGTADGLNRYDGYQFKVFKNDPNNPSSISSNRIFSLCEDSSETLWLGTYGGGLNKYDKNTEDFIHYKNISNDPSSLSNNDIYVVFQDNSNILWIGTDGGGLNKFIPEKNHFKRYNNNPNNSGSLSNDEIRSICEDHLGYLWIGTKDGGLNKFDKKTEFFTNYKNDIKDPNSLSDDEILSIYEDSFNNLWIGTGSGGLNKFNRGEETFNRYTSNSLLQSNFSANRIFSILEDESHNLWLGTMEGGLKKFVPAKNIFVSYKSVQSIDEDLSSKGIFSLFKDRTGILWIGTYGGGINKLNLSKEKFKLIRNYSPESINVNSLSSNDVFSICEDREGLIWIGTSNGLNKLDRRSKKFFIYKNYPFDPMSLSNNEVLTIFENRFGELWIGTYGGGLNLFDRKTNKFISYKNKSSAVESISENKIFAICEDDFGNIWIGTDGGGLNKFDKEKKEFTRYLHDSKDSNSLSANRIFSLYKDISGNLWIGTDSGGLNKLDLKKGKFRHYKNKPNDPSSLSNDGVLSIYQTKSGEIWIGTYGGGLNKFEISKESFENYRTKEGLPNDVIYGILEDSEGNLWLSTNHGISRFNPKTKTFKNYNESDGLQGNEFNQGAYFKSITGEMFFGGPNGLNTFYPDSIIGNRFPPQIVITDFQLLHKKVSVGYDSLFSRKILDKSICEADKIELNYDDNVISFEFAALDFWNPQKNQYAYLMEGFDKEWTYTDANRRIVTYTNLDPGEYTLKVKASNNDDVWNKAGLSLKIIINPPWWATWWAYILYFLFFLFVFTGSTRFYLNRQRLRHQLELEQENAKKLQEIDKIKSNFYANISHEFRTPLMLILGPVEKLISKLTDEDSKKQTGLIKGNAQRLLNLINQLLDLSRLEAGKLKLQASLGNIAQFVKGLAMEFESIAERRDITLRINIEKESIEAYFDKEKMEKIINNVMSNAFKFTTSGGKVNVKLIETSDKKVQIIVKDSGIGISKSELTKIFDRFYQVDGSHTREHEGTGIGLALTKELVELHKGQIFIDSEEGQWTEVKLLFPLGKEHLNSEEIIESADFALHKVDVMDDYLKEGLEPADYLNENLIDKTIVLVVEDNPDVRDYVKDALKEFYHVEEAANGEQGLRKAEKFIPDLIISDIMMPKMDGYELTRKIKQDEKTSHIPVILLTAKSDKDSKLEGLGLGADDYLVKPFDSDELLARIKNLIETRRTLQEKFGAGTILISKPDKPKLNAVDEQFMNRIMTVIEDHLSEEEFSIEEFGKDVGMSRSQMHRKLKALTGKSASVYLRTVRLAKAKQMIAEKKGTISEISYWVGFSSPAYFSRCFKDEFGYAPSDHPK